MKIYKYVTPETLWKILENESFSVKNINQYNDPYEGRWVQRIFKRKSDIGEDGVICDLNETLYYTVKLREMLKLTCFSELNNIDLMWSHYAQSHKGFCLEFEVDEAEECSTEGHLFFLSSDVSGYAFRKVRYADALPELAHYEGDSKDHKVERVLQCLSTKSMRWSYECEYRYIFHANKTTEFISYNSKLLTAIIVGAKAEQDDIINLTGFIDKKKNNFKEKFQLLYAHLSEDCFDINILAERYNPEPNDHILRIELF